jgi:hypothetical protein
MNVDPYAAPEARLADTVPGTGVPVLWNPAAAAAWSLLFSPAFGAMLHMLNWRALGNAEKEAAAKSWFIASLVVFAMFTVCALMLPQGGAFDVKIHAVGLGYLLVWYLSTGRVQVRFVKARYGSEYQRKAWRKPLAVALSAVLAYLIAILAMAFVFGLAK